MWVMIVFNQDRVTEWDNQGGEEMEYQTIGYSKGDIEELGFKRIDREGERGALGFVEAVGM